MIYSALSLTYPAFLNFIAAYVSELAGYDIEDANTLIYN